MKDQSSVPVAQKMTDVSLLIFPVEVQKRRIQMIDNIASSATSRFRSIEDKFMVRIANISSIDWTNQLNRCRFAQRRLACARLSRGRFSRRPDACSVSIKYFVYW